ncbi:NRPS [Onygenales sp. PD_40]|nr:NRPS [Onygenales sp. PD_40]
MTNEISLAGVELSAFPPSYSKGRKYTLSSTVFKAETLSWEFPVDASVLIQSAWSILIGLALNTKTVSFALHQHGGNSKPHKDEINKHASSLSQVRTSLETVKTLAELFNVIQTQQASDHDDRNDTCSSILGVAPCLAGQVPSDSCKDVADAALELGADRNTALLVACTWNGSDIYVAAKYDDQALSPMEADRLLGQLFYLVRNLSTSDCTSTLGQLQFCGPEDRSQIRQWNEHCPEPVMKLAHEIITWQANCNPNAMALDAWDAQLTYRELEKFSSAVAHRLLSLGVQPDSLVPFCFDKSAWAIVAMLGILKAGAAFVALDPAHPIERLKGLVEIVQPQILLTSKARYERLCVLAPNTVVISRPEVTRLLKLGHSTETLSDATPSNLAYVIFTSGSTGTPKGVMIEHHSLSHSCLALGTSMKSGPETRMLQFSSFTFDASVLEIFPTLFHGGCVCMPSDSDRVDNPVEYINENGIDLIFLTPSIAGLLNPASIPNVHTLVTGGEAFSGDTLKSWLETRTVMNAYGPSEITIACNIAQLAPGDPSKRIGHAISTASWIVDPEDHTKLVPIGCVGELLVQGHTLARGYFHDEEKTASVFVESPPWYEAGHSPNAPTRFYKTGDLVRYECNGTLIYLGRKDSMIKIRGQRTELGEIEHHLSTQGMVNQALVLFPSTGSLKHQLVGILVLNDETKANFDGEIRVVEDEAGAKINEIRRSISKSLPSYMVPSHLMAVQSFPLLPSGKVNKRRLTQWVEEIDRSVITAELQTPAGNSPMSDIEVALQQIIGEVLNIPIATIDIQRSFLGLGGDSISAMQIVTHCRTQGLYLTTRNILGSSSISEMALHVTASRKQIISDGNEEETNAKFALSPIQRMYFSLVPNGDNEFNQGFLLRLSDRVHDTSLELAIKAVVERHSLLRARFSCHDGKWEQYISDDAESSYRVVSHKAQCSEATTASLPQSETLINVETGPIIVADIITTDSEGKFLRLTAHHLVMDLVSWRVILHDLEEFLSRGHLAPEIPLPFQTWLRAQDEYTSNAVLPTVLQSFEDAPPDLAYWGKTDKVTAPVEHHTRSFTLGTDLTEKVMKGCHSSLRTDAVDIMLAALLFSFGVTFNDRPMPTIFDEGHGRNMDEGIDISRTVGWFTVLFPILVAPTQNGTIVDMIRRVKDFRRTLAGHEITFFSNQLLKHDNSHTKNFPVEILFNFFGQYQQLEKTDAFLQQVPNGITENLGRLPLNIALFEVSALVERSQLRFTFTYGADMHHQEEIQSWITDFVPTLQLAVDSLQKLNFEYTTSDFPLLELDYGSLDILVNERVQQLAISSLTEVDDIYPCTPMQDGILASQASNPGLYRSAIRWKITAEEGGIVDVDRLVEAWHKVVQRHSILRTAFLPSVSQQSLFIQAVLKNYAPQVSVTSCAEDDIFKPVSREHDIETQSMHEHRFAIYSTDPSTAFCELSINHALFDGTSVQIVVRNLTLAYKNQLPPQIGPRYKSFVQHIRLRSDKNDQAYWGNYLAHCPSTHIPCTEGPQTDYAEHAIALDPSLVQKIRHLCVQGELTTANVVQCAWALVLRGLTDSNSVCFGCLTSGRDVDVEGILDAVGAFMNMLVCRFDMAEGDSLINVLHKSKGDFQQSLEHQHMFLAEVHRILGLQGEHLFNTAISFQRPAATDMMTGGSFNVEVLSDNDPSEYDVTLNVYDSPETFAVAFRYWGSRVPEEQMRVISDMFVGALGMVANRPEERIGKLDLSGIQHYRIFEWNKYVPAPTERCLHEIFESVAETCPNKEAVYSSNETFSYRELDSLSSNLAVKLVAAGVGPEVLVPICFEKSIWAIIAMLGVLKAGGGFVPLDPSHPSQRHLTIIKEVKARIILGSTTTATTLRSYVPVVIEVSRETIARDDHPKSNPLNNLVTPSNVAYIIFTSGSTGKPKGVVIEHRAVSSSCTEHAEPMAFEASSRVLQFSSYTFDAAIAEIFTTLTKGGTVCVPTDQERMGNIVPFINEARVNWVFSTPSFIRTVEPKSVPTVRTLAVGGEILGQDILSTWTPHVTFIHVYGPTECCIFSVAHTVDRNKAHRVILGRSFGSVSWIVDPNDPNKLSRLGAVGELLLQGPILARGYLNDPGKTMAAFIDSPAWLGSEGQKMYRTGDLVRYNPDGTMMYIGRKDNQVKLRGQRLETGEVEYNISLNLPERTAVAVELVGRVGTEGSKALAAFICDDASCTDAIKDSDLFDPMTEEFLSEMKNLRQKLLEALPPYMVPSMYIHMKKMPPTPTGKLDRQLLRRLVVDLSQKNQGLYSLMTADRKDVVTTEAEKKLQGFWAKLLKMETSNIGPGSNFFHLGGDSIAALHLMNILRDNKLSIEIAQIFRNPFLKNMASCIIDRNDPDVVPLKAFSLIEPPDSTSSLIGLAAEICQVEPASILDIYPCTPLQEGLLALSNKLAGAYVSQFIFRLPEHIDTDGFKNAWSSVVARTPIMRTRIIAMDSSVWQVVISEDIRWEDDDLRLDDYLAEDKRRGISPQAPLSRYALLHERTDRYFVLTSHHSLYDAWSLSLLFKRVERLYHQDRSPSPPQYEFNTFIQHIASINKEESRRFWSGLLAGAKQSRFPQLPNTGYLPVIDKTISLPIELNGSLQGDYTISTILQVAWAIILSQYTESKDVTFGFVVSGRNAAVSGISYIVGPTVATVPVRVELDPNRPLAHLLQSIQHQSTERIPFEQEGLQNISCFSQDARAACDFHNLFVVQPFSTEDGTILGSKKMETDYNSSRATPLTIECSIGDGKLEIAAHFDSSLIGERKMGLFMHQFAHTFLEISSNHERSIREISRCSEYEKQLIKKWNEKIPHPMETCVHHLFKRQALAWPNAPAIHAWDFQLTYSEVNRYATAFAHHVSNLGVRPEVLVPIVMDKSAWTIVAMIGVLKAGGACAALDPSHPTDRLRGIIQDTGSPIVLVSPHYENRFPGLADKAIPISKTLFDELPPQKDDPLTTVHFTNAAFVIFTSGSTGKPKGIVIEHVHICTSSEAHGSIMEVGIDSRVFSFASYAFDVSLGDTWTTLMRGGCVCVPSEGDRMNNLAQTITEMRVNWIGLTPTVSRLLAPESVPTVKTLSLGGEPIGKEDTAAWADHVRVWNFYGPAETVIGATLCDLSADRARNPRTLGYGIDANLWVVDQDNHDALVPIGTAGELLIQGPAISRGYLKDPEKTARSYLTRNPAFLNGTDFGATRTQKIFKTGDLVFQNPEDGAIVYIGRKDTQIKIHGQRIELQEIEEQLAANSSEEHAWVVELIQGSGTESACLAAFYTRHDVIGKRDIKVQTFPITAELRDTLSDLKRRISGLLPKYMVPSMFVPLTTMPLNTSGKTDRLQLRAIGAAVSERPDAASYMLSKNLSRSKDVKRQPGTKKGRKMQKLWSKVLKLPEASIGALDDFFELGGNSIIAMKLAASAHAAGLSVSVADIFGYPRLDDISDIAEDSKVVQIVPRTVSKSRTNHALHESLALQLPSGSSIEYIGEATDYQVWTAIHGMTRHQGFINDLFVEFDGDVDVLRVREACEIVVHHNPILRAAFTAHEDQVMLVSLRNISIDFQQFSWNEETDTAAPLAWEQEGLVFGKPPLRFALIRKFSRAYRLVIRISHAQYDGISIPLVLDDLKTAYNSLVGTPRSNFFDFLDENTSKDNTPHLDFWAKLLKDSSMTQIVSHKGLHHTGPVNSSTIQTINTPSLAASTGITTATIFKAAWGLVLSTLSGSMDITFGHITAGRNAYVPRFDTTIGAFLNITPIRVRLDGSLESQTSAQLIHSLHAQHVDSLPHDSVGWRNIIKSCTSWPSWSTFSSILQHQNLNNVKGQSVRGIARVGAAVDIWVLTAPRGEETDVELHFSSHIPESAAREMLAMFCTATSKLCDPICREEQVSTLLERTQVHLPFSPLPPTNSENGLVAEQAVGEESDQFRSLQQIVRKAWKNVVGQSRGNNNNLTLSESYLDLGGDLVTAGLLAHAYHAEGYHGVAVEDIMDSTTMREQIECLAGAST